MANTVVVRYREATRGPVGALVLAWALVVAVCLFFISAQRGPNEGAFNVAVWLTVALGVVLGIRSRTGVSFFAPVVSWLFAVVPFGCGFLVHEFSAGSLFGAVVWDTVGWMFIGAMECTILFTVATVVRLALSPFRHRSEIVIYPPGHHED